MAYLFNYFDTSAIDSDINIYRCAEEPMLEEWMGRAKLYDMLHKTVSSFFFFAIVLWFTGNIWNLTIWINFQVRIAMVGKYTGLSDSYLSVLKVSTFITHQSNVVRFLYVAYLLDGSVFVILSFLRCTCFLFVLHHRRTTILTLETHVIYSLCLL